MSDSLPLFDLNFTAEEEEAVLAVLRSKWISMGPKTAELEEVFSNRLGIEHAVAVSSGTAALHLAMAVLDIGPGDEVIVPSMTFVATANAVRYVGATPVFADIVGPHDLSIDPAEVEAKITPRTRAILPMHYAGFACDMGTLLALAARHGLAVVEDAAHSLDSFVGDKHLGTLGEIGCFSFFSNKNVSCAEGGMLVTASEDLAKKARLMRSHGMTSVSYERATGRATSYDVIVPGFSYRLDDLRSSLGLCQLGKLSQETERRRVLRERYLKGLAEIEEIVVPYRDYPHPAGSYIFPIILKEGGAERRDLIRARLADKGIQTSVHYPAVHRFSIYRDTNLHLPQTEHVADHEITLPMFGGLTEAQIDRVVGALKESL